MVLHGVEPALAIAREHLELECFIIGGAEIYRLALPFTTRMYLTEIDAIVEGDTYFPEFKKENWKEMNRKHHPADNRHPYAFDIVVYDRVNP